LTVRVSTLVESYKCTVVTKDGACVREGKEWGNGMDRGKG